MERRLLIAGLLMIAILALNRMFMPPPPEPEVAPASETAGGAAPDTEAAASSPAAAPDQTASGLAGGIADLAKAGSSWNDPLAWGDPAAQAHEVVIETDLYRAVIDTRGARLRSWRLLEFNGAHGDPGLELVPTDSDGGLTLELTGEGGKLDLSNAVFLCDRRSVRLGAGTSSDSLLLRLPGPGGVEFREVLHVSNDTYSFGIDFQLTNPDGSPHLGREALDVTWYPGLEPTERNIEQDFRYYGVLASQNSGQFRASLRHFGRKPETDPLPETHWAVIRSKYFLLAAVPRVQGNVTTRFSGDPDRARLSFSMTFPPIGTFAGPAPGEGALAAATSDAGVEPPDPHGVFHRGDFELYLGPMDYDLLAGYGAGLENAVDLGWRWIRPLSRLMHSFMEWMHGFIPNWGLTIILFSALTKLAFYPLTHKSVKSMREMQKIQPRMAELREKHKDDPQRQQKEMMKLYREAGVNPLGGCLPMLLQSPVFIALYNVLQHTIELRQASFFLWIDDLSSPDHLFTMPFSVPGLGNSFNLLPLLMGVGMYWQQKTSSPGGGDPRMRMMTVMMPFMFTFMFYRFPSGLVLYWLVNTGLTIVQQSFINRSEKSAVPVVEEATASKRRRRRSRRKGGGQGPVSGDGASGNGSGGGSSSNGSMGDSNIGATRGSRGGG